MLRGFSPVKENADLFRVYLVDGHVARADLNLNSQPEAALQPAFHDQETRFSRAFALIREAIDQRAFPGAALAVTYHGALIASQGFGRFTYEAPAPEVHADTVFDLASVTKVVATTAVAMVLYERGALHLESPISAVLPDFVALAPPSQQADRRAVTVRM